MKWWTNGTAGVWALLVAATPFALPATAAAQETGPEWVSLTAEEARIVFVAPRLEGLRARYLRGAAEDRTYEVEVALWTGPSAPHAKAIIQYIKVSPGRHYRARTDPKVFIKNFTAFEGKELEIGRRKRGGNRLGTIESRRFSFDDVECLGFAVYWGQSGGIRASVGTNLLYGYYCADPGQPLTEETRKAVIKAMGVKGKAVPDVPVVLTVQAWLERPGRAAGLYFGTLRVVGDAAQGELQIRLPSPYGTCSGHFKQRRRAAIRSSDIDATWEVNCTDRLGARGEYRSAKSGAGHGEGRTTDGARLDLTITR